MALTTLANVRAIPGLSSTTTFSDAYLNALISAVDKIIKNYTKRDLESASYVEYYSGKGHRDLVLRQYPVTAVTYVRIDAGGAWGAGPSAFPSTSALTDGTQFALITEGGDNRGLLRKVGGLGGFFTNLPPLNQGGSKLAASRLPVWPIGDGNLKVSYTAGYASGAIPADLTHAANLLTAWAAYTTPRGFPLASESHESYSYSIMTQLVSGNPDLSSVVGILKAYRDQQW